MRILLLSDVECKALWDHYQPERLAGLDLIVSCGDLKKDYLEFLVTLGRKPVFYVPGNHDEGYVRNPPEGCECLDGQVITYQGLRFTGFGGCKRYTPMGTYQYTEREMARRIRKMRRPVRKAGGVDVVVTHAPVFAHGDAADLCHQGFLCFQEMLDRWQPKYLVHGHVHMNYGANAVRVQQYGNTTLINAYERYVLDV